MKRKKVIKAKGKHSGRKKGAKTIPRKKKMDDLVESQASEKIFLDKEGRWFHEGVEITHPLTVELFSRSVVKDPSAGYRLQIGREWAKIKIEDTPYMIKTVEIQSNQVLILLNDKSVEKLEPDTLWIGKNNVLYCRVKNGEYPARFLRPAYYQLMQALKEKDNKFYLEIGNQRIFLEPFNELRAKA